LPAFWATAALAQDFHPYADGQVPKRNGSSYSMRCGQARRLGAQFRDEHLVVFEDPSRQLYFRFPRCQVIRRIPPGSAGAFYSEGGEAGTEQVGYYAGDRAQFEALYESYQRLTQRMQGDDERDNRPRPTRRNCGRQSRSSRRTTWSRTMRADFERAYAMLSPTLQQLSPYTDWREHAAAALVRFGKPQGHDILKITWYQNPPTAVLPAPMRRSICAVTTNGSPSATGAARSPGEERRVSHLAPRSERAR